MIRQSFILLLAAFLASCEKDEEENIARFTGPETAMGNGKATAFITVNENNQPLEIGVEMTAGAMQGLTQDPANFAAATFLLQLPQQAKDLTPFDHLVVNWNPQGHDPANVFTVPHFDFHFYMMTPAERTAIPPYLPSTAAMHDHLPPSGYMPASFHATPGGVPQMGKHWGDQHMHTPFSHTMVYGSYNGKVTFLEPMITKAVLESGQSINVAYAQPALFEKTGKYYPSRYQIRIDDATHTHSVTLSDFVLR